VTRVLAIDDHPIVLQGCRQLLTDAGVDEVVPAQTLDEASSIYRRQKPDVIIIDLAMQTDMLGGLLFIQTLRRHDRLNPLLVFTMHRNPIIVRRAIELGATGYLLRRAKYSVRLQSGLVFSARLKAIAEASSWLR
jgi:two-component system, NarL family, invasion response regulator UvrY